MAFWRRPSRGKHALGAAVRSVPAAAPAPIAVSAPAADWSFPEQQPPAPAGPRVELTFRDGSTASLDAVQARALDEIAQVLTRRD